MRHGMGAEVKSAAVLVDFDDVRPGPLSTQRAVEWVYRSDMKRYDPIYDLVYVESAWVQWERVDWAELPVRYLEVSNTDGRLFVLTQTQTTGPAIYGEREPHVGVHLGKKLLVGVNESFPTEANVARLLGVARSTVNRWFKGEQAPSAEVLSLVSRLFGWPGALGTLVPRLTVHEEEELAGRVTREMMKRFRLAGRVAWDPFLSDEERKDLKRDAAGC